MINLILSWWNALPKSWKSRFFKIPTGYVESTRVYCEARGHPFILLFSGEISRRSRPETPEPKVHWKFIPELEHHHPDVFCAHLPNAYLVGSGGAVLSEDRRLLLDVSQQFGSKKTDQHDVFTHYIINPKVKFLNQSLAVIAALAERSYFHWMIDVLPRLHILELAGALPVDGFIVNALKLPAARESLGLLGIPKHKIIEIDYWAHLKAKTLVVPSLPGITGNPAPWVCQFLRQFFLPRVEFLPSPIASCIYISRRSRRKIANESELNGVLGKYKFSTIVPEQLSLLQQVKIFSQARVILAPHGAALTNLIFCRPGTKVIEIFSPNYVNVCFWSIANQVGLKYSYLEGEGDKPEAGIDPQHVHEDIFVNPSKLEGWLSNWI